MGSASPLNGPYPTGGARHAGAGVMPMALLMVVAAVVAVALCASAAPAYAQTLGEIPADGISVQRDGTRVSIDWQDADGATRYLVQMYIGTLHADSLFVTDSILANKELRPGVLYTITATPYADSRAGVTRELAVIKVDDAPPPPDTTAPVITLNGPAAVSAILNGTYVERGATCTDDTDASPRLAVDSAGIDTSILSPPPQNVTYTCTDSSGNAATATRTVTVTERDAAPPVITLNGPSAVSIMQGGTYAEPGASCTDDTDPSPVLTTSGAVNANLAGLYAVTYTCTDSSGNAATSTRTVTVEPRTAQPDTTAPVITLNGPSAVSIMQGGTYAEPGASCTDDTDPSPVLTTSGAVNANLAGLYAVTYACTDMSGNSNTAVRTVTVAPGAATSEIARLAGAVENLTRILESLALRVGALEADIARLDGALGGPRIADSGNFVPVYHDATDPYNMIQKSWYEDQRFLEGFTERLSQTLVLPYDVYVTMGECDTINAFYYPSNKSIVICYEYATYLEGLLDPYYDTDAELFEKVDAVVTFVTLHELGHALVDVYDLPITGNEEDAVDQFAAIVTLEYIPSGQSSDILSATLIAYLESGRVDSIFPTENQLAGEHSLDSQRFYNIACWMYGSDLHRYSFLVDRGILPENRAERCQSEYERLSESWYELVSPFLINPGSVPPP